jgi:Tfp pilus assembly protein PilN
MVEINLLPWRIYLKEHTIKRNMIKLFFSIIFLIIFCAVIHINLNNQFRQRYQVIGYLQKRMTAMNILRKQDYPDNIRIRMLMDYQRDREQLIHFFYELMSLTPEDIHWQNIVSQEGQIILTGKTNSYHTLLEFIKMFSDIKNALQMDLLKIKQLPDSDFLQFSLKVYPIIFVGDEQQHVQ